jgi:hypothetical protein
MTETKTERFEMLMAPSRKAALAFLAEQNGRSLAAEIRVALDAWLDRAPWLEAAMREASRAS